MAKSVMDQARVTPSPDNSLRRHSPTHPWRRIPFQWIGMRLNSRGDKELLNEAYRFVGVAGNDLLTPTRRMIIGQAETAYQNSALPGVRGNGITSRMLAMPVRNRMVRSSPRPKPECGTVP